MPDETTIPIQHILIPVPAEDEVGLPMPEIKDYQNITVQEVKIDGKLYEKFEYIPDYIDLCRGGNAKRIRGNKIRLLTKHLQGAA